MIRILRMLLRPLALSTSQKNTNTAPDDDLFQWVNARGKPIGSKRSRTKRLERQRDRERSELRRTVNH